MISLFSTRSRIQQFFRSKLASFTYDGKLPIQLAPTWYHSPTTFCKRQNLPLRHHTNWSVSNIIESEQFYLVYLIRSLNLCHSANRSRIHLIFYKLQFIFFFITNINVYIKGNNIFLHIPLVHFHLKYCMFHWLNV